MGETHKHRLSKLLRVVLDPPRLQFQCKKSNALQSFNFNSLNVFPLLGYAVMHAGRHLVWDDLCAGHVKGWDGSTLNCFGSRIAAPPCSRQRHTAILIRSITHLI